MKSQFFYITFWAKITLVTKTQNLHYRQIKTILFNHEFKIPLKGDN
jgi:hypothetical protein